jgi:hypothetical protein
MARQRASSTGVKTQSKLPVNKERWCWSRRWKPKLGIAVGVMDTQCRMEWVARDSVELEGSMDERLKRGRMEQGRPAGRMAEMLQTSIVGLEERRRIEE